MKQALTTKVSSFNERGYINLSHDKITNLFLPTLTQSEIQQNYWTGYSSTKNKHNAGERRQKKTQSLVRGFNKDKHRG
jgi:hypothetical protein